MELPVATIRNSHSEMGIARSSSAKITRYTTPHLFGIGFEPSLSIMRAHSR
jgi:hypothetical protein